MSDYVIVLKNGEIEEQGSMDNIIMRGKSNYTKNLISSII